MSILLVFLCNLLLLWLNTVKKYYPFLQKDSQILFYIVWQSHVSVTQFSSAVQLFGVFLQLLHEYWMVLRDHVSAIDELAMATERLRVRHPDEPKPNPPVLHIIEPHEVQYWAGKNGFFLKEPTSYKNKICVWVCV